ncbi:Spy/CpxP family protein refolding chaperone [Thermosynechococcus sp. HN-54]|uniref:Spy/CpxP family protein refolding chaperone n=1 Tax=Thermosynechococcus sp. HN-54 TaxID=2933959 RepID=UPI00202CB49A|nr:Spy/CpxP family protein refolding chaperone [Thermosynechococcus sp. HN-54]URR36297.1 Spy/CpxP family protein refolding chaperone [Thermosynechococcus sp. HN-54]
MSLRQPLLWGCATIIISLISLGANAAPLTQWMERLSLTPQQAQQVQAIDRQYKQKVQEQQAALNTAEEQLEKLLVAGAPTAQLQQQFDLVMSLREMLQRTRFAAALEVQQVLSPAQRQQLAAMNRQRLVNLRNYFQQGATKP